MKVFSRVIGTLAVASQSLQAFPPAPGFTICGNARDHFGWVLTAESKAVVVVRQDGKIIAESAIGSVLSSTQNFKVVLPIDTRPVDAYIKDANPPGVQFTLEVKLGEAVYPITNLKVTNQLVAEAGGKVFVDFSYAEDSDGDGIPDSWELWQLGEAGIAHPDPRFSLDTFSRDGDFDRDGTKDRVEYLAGTFAFLSSETLDLKVKDLTAPEWISFDTFVVASKKYRLEASTDLKNWEVVSVKLEGETEARSIFTADDTRDVILETAQTADSAKRHFRLKVQ